MKNKIFKKLVSTTLSVLIALSCAVNFNPNNSLSAITWEQVQTIKPVIKEEGKENSYEILKETPFTP